MINLELPLEINRPNYGEISLLTSTDTVITIETENGTVFAFDRITGLEVAAIPNDNPRRLRNKSDEVAVTYRRIWFGHVDWTKDQWRYLQDDALYQFEDPKLAAARSKELNAESAAAEAPWRFMVKKHVVMSANHNWRDWMTARFASEEYVPVPWANESWAIADHFAHFSAVDPFKIAYVETALHGVEDKMTVTNVGRYLEKFFSEKLSAQERAAWTAKADSEADFVILTGPDAIEDCYVNSGIESCMRYASDSQQFPLGVQPTRCYGSPDLGLATLQRKGKVVARCLVRIDGDNKIAGRIYGDIERMKNRLIAEGFTYTDGNARAFHGARLLRIEVDGILVLPYLDWNMGANDLDDNYLVFVDKNLDRAKYAGTSTNGSAEGKNFVRCGECSTRFTQGEGLYNSNTGREMCMDCADEHLVQCIVSRNYYPRGSAYQVLNRQGEPMQGHRGGFVHPDYLSDQSNYRRIGDNVYWARDTRPVEGRRGVYELIPA